MHKRERGKNESFPDREENAYGGRCVYALTYAWTKHRGLLWHCVLRICKESESFVRAME